MSFLRLRLSICVNVDVFRMNIPISKADFLPFVYIQEALQPRLVWFSVHICKGFLFALSKATKNWHIFY